MNKTYIRLTATLAMALALASCQKGDLLNIIRDEVELNENTPQYQAFIKERITDYAKAYRFEQARANLPKLTDAETQRESQRIIDFYHAKALKDGFAYILPSGDSLFLKMKNENNLKPEERKGLERFQQYAEFKGLNQYVTLWGLGNYPNIENLMFDESWIDKVLDLDKLTKLKKVGTYFNNSDVDYEIWFPGQPFRPVPMVGYDFSKNNTIERFDLLGADVSDFKGPQKPFAEFKMRQGIFNAATLNNVYARTIDLSYSQPADPDVKVKNPYLRRLFISIPTDWANGKFIRTLDISETNITHLSFIQGGKEELPIKEIKLSAKIDTLQVIGSTQTFNPKPNDLKIVGLEKLSALKLFSYNPECLPLLPQDIPCPVTSLAIEGSGDVPFNTDALIDYSKVKGLKVLENSKYISATTIYPTQLDTLLLKPYRYMGTIETLDLSHLKLRAIVLELGSVYALGTQDFSSKDNTLSLKRIVLPSTLTSADLEDLSTEVVDLSNLDKLSKLKIYDVYQDERSIKKIIFPKNLKRSNFKASSDFLVKVDKERTELVNYPSWVTQDEFGNDIAK